VAGLLNMPSHLQGVADDNSNGSGGLVAGFAGLRRGSIWPACGGSGFDTEPREPADRVNRQFQAPRPNALWVADFTVVATWQGFVYVAFVIDTFARRIVGWRVSRTAHAGFVLDALEQALNGRRPGKGSGLIHHFDRLDPPMPVR
jgi:transposase InsO family protein